MSEKRPVDQTLIEYIAALARLNVSPDELAALTRQIADILSYFAKLDELDLPGDESAPAAASPPRPPIHETARRDDFQTVLAALAPDSAPPYVRVPRVIDAEDDS
ncbi:MAG: aspartyl/glutamyl-tRNA amidotransferase subunit C [Candidatus Lernaella stagnicola]|nr:aspartyl/glutamyl-tRNA amidotransferase subunit C [Candidatus Lernaella stagnicola]